jgi:hypothetical protein
MAIDISEGHRVVWSDVEPVDGYCELGAETLMALRRLVGDSIEPQYGRSGRELRLHAFGLHGVRLA